MLERDRTVEDVKHLKEQRLGVAQSLNDVLDAESQQLALVAKSIGWRLPCCHTENVPSESLVVSAEALEPCRRSSGRSSRPSHWTRYFGRTCGTTEWRSGRRMGQRRVSRVRSPSPTLLVRRNVTSRSLSASSRAKNSSPWSVSRLSTTMRVVLSPMASPSSATVPWNEGSTTLPSDVATPPRSRSASREVLDAFGCEAFGL